MGTDVFSEIGVCDRLPTVSDAGWIQSVKTKGGGHSWMPPRRNALCCKSLKACMMMTLIPWLVPFWGYRCLFFHGAGTGAAPSPKKEGA